MTSISFDICIRVRSHRANKIMSLKSVLPLEKLVLTCSKSPPAQFMGAVGRQRYPFAVLFASSVQWLGGEFIISTSFSIRRSDN